MEMRNCVVILEEIRKKFPEGSDNISLCFDQVEKTLSNTICVIAKELSEQILKGNFNVNELLKLAEVIKTMQGEFVFGKETLQSSIYNEFAISNDEGFNEYIKLLDTINSKIKTKKENALNDKLDKKTQIEVQAIKILRALDVPEDTIGYHFLKSCIVHAVMDYRMLYGGITNKLYPIVAKEFEVNSYKVMNRISSTIDIVVKNNSFAYNNMYKHCKKNPTNSQFLKIIRYKIINELNLKDERILEIA